MSCAGLVQRNLCRNLRRTILTGATVALATFIFVILISVPASVDRIVADASKTLRLVVSNRTAPWYDLPARYCTQISEMPGCAACVAISGWPATYRDQRDQIVAVAEGLEISDVFPDYDLPGTARRAFERERRGAFAGSILIDKYRWKPGQQITLRSANADQMELSFILLGPLPSNRYSNVFAFRRDYLAEARKAAGLGDVDVAWNLVVRADSADNVAPLASEIDNNFRNSDYETRTVTESDALAAGLSELGSLRTIAYSLSAVVLLTVLLIAANSSAMMIRERLSDVALMRALGFSGARISSLLMTECATVGAAGGAAGAGVAFALFHGGVTLAGVLGGTSGALWVTAQGGWTGLGVAIALSVLSGAAPIFAALRIPPALAFREVV